MRRTPKESLALPLDVADLPTAQEWILRMRGEVGVFKVGLELFTACGPAAVQAVNASGAHCFLDLKLHDIPATVMKATESAIELGARYLTVHAANGPDCLARAAKVADDTGLELLAVTVLTSMDDSCLDAIGLRGPVNEAVLRLAKMAFDSGIIGFVCSPHECEAMRETLGPDATLVVPGIRPAGSEQNDQKRIATPEAAITKGADLLVVGRPIREAQNPITAARSITAEIAAGLAKRDIARNAGRVTGEQS